MRRIIIRSTLQSSGNWSKKSKKNIRRKCMNLSVRRCITSCVLAAVICFPSLLSAQTHVVNPADLQKEVLAATTTRQQNVDTVTGFLSDPQGARNAGSGRHRCAASEDRRLVFERSGTGA